MKSSRVAMLRQGLATCSCGLCIFISGTVLGWTSPVIPKMQKTGDPMKITDDEISWMVAIVYAGILTSPIPTSYAMDFMGRRNILLSLSVLPVSGWLTIYFATHPYELYIARFLFGLWHGGITTIAPHYVAETAEARIRGALATLLQIIFNLGMIFCYAVGPFVSYHTFAIILVVIPCIYLVCLGFMPESPYWYLMKKDREKARKSLTWLRARNDEEIDKEVETLERSIQEEMERERSFKSFFSKSYRRAIVTTMVYSICFNFTGMNVVAAYASTLMPGHGMGNLSDDMSAMVMAILWTAAIPFATLLIDNMGRRSLIIISSFGCGLTLFIVGLHDFLSLKTSLDMSKTNWLVFACLIIYGMVFFAGLGPVGFVIKGEMFPTNIKAMASAVNIEVSSIAAFISVKMYQPINDAVGLYLSFWGFYLCLLRHFTFCSLLYY